MKIKLWHQILMALVLGVIVGTILNVTDVPFFTAFMKSLGDFFFRLIKMLIVPLIFVSLVVGMTSMKDAKKIGSVALKVFVLYLLTTAIAIIIGLFTAISMKIGKGVDHTGATVPEKIQAAAETKISFADTILGLIPTNIIEAMASANILQIIVFAILFGMAMNWTGAKSEKLREVFESASDVIYKLTDIVMYVAPIGVFGVMSWAVATYGAQIVGSLLAVVLAAYLASIIHALVVYSVLLGVAGLNPVTFFKKVISPAVFAFVSTSSSGTLPVSIATAREKMGVSEGISAFVLPLGATINMDGTAIYLGVSAIFVANLFGVDLTMTQYGMIVLMATLASIGTAGAPGAGFIMLSGLLIQVGLPLEGMGLIFAIDRVLDMARTCVNVVGDHAVNLVVARSEKEVDLDIYNNTQI